jgi:hypothetical protein
LSAVDVGRVRLEVVESVEEDGLMSYKPRKEGRKEKADESMSACLVEPVITLPISLLELLMNGKTDLIHPVLLTRHAHRPKDRPFPQQRVVHLLSSSYCRRSRRTRVTLPGREEDLGRERRVLNHTSESDERVRRGRRGEGRWWGGKI